MATLQDVLREWENEPVLLDDGATHWRDERGYQILPIMYLGEERYCVQHEPKGYHIIRMEDEKCDVWRYIYGQNLYQKKQSAYRRKSHLKEGRQKHRILGA